MKKIKILAARLDKRQYDLIERAINEFINKYERKASLAFLNKNEVLLWTLPSGSASLFFF